MSGGRFNYVYFRVDNEDVLGTLDDLREAEAYARIVGRHDAADEIYSLILTIETCKRHLERHGRRLTDLLSSVEYAASHDADVSEIDKSYQKLVAGDEQERE